ncbi:APC family permease [Clostridium magnum]|uniref:Serine/threonine exchanger SteT n=1 Tax=Clostridium magnum DSM 2767 TaxID=1121326 RepID=A0A162THT0_9CLOT|nr:amino acid permease [Clostridium magnum]KZL92661.1 serine/threonine exchanger SteT [Clostridium magnum DSM 2767]SHI24266.1 Amino acid transporter [Clostridium magnum DSM 2767]
MAISKNDPLLPGSSKGSKGNIGKMTALLLTSAMMVGTGIFTTLGAATEKAHSGILIAMIIGAVIALLTGINAAQLGINYPQEGGAFIWMRIFGYPTISFIAGISYFMKGIVTIGIESLGFAKYSEQVFHGVPITIVASIALLVVATINFFGIAPTSKVLISIFFTNLILLGLYVGFTIPKVKMSNFTPVFGPGIAAVLGGAGTFFWAWDGFQRVAIMANEIKNPRKTIPFAIIGGISIAAVIYLIVAGTTLGVLGASAIGKSDEPLFLGGKKAIGGFIPIVILSSAWILAFSDLLGDLMTTSKLGHSMANEHELPYLLGIVHKRLKTPQYMVLLLTVVIIVLVNLVPLRKLLPVASTCTLIWYVITNIATLKINKEKRFAWPVTAWFGIIACLALLFSLPLWSTLGAVGFVIILTGIRWLIIRVVEKSVVDAGGNWTVSGLTLAQGDIISVTAQYAGEKESTAVITIVAAAAIQTTAPVIPGTVTAVDTTISGKAPTGANVVLSVNGVAQSAVTANGGNWIVPCLVLTEGDIVSVTAQSVGERISMAATTIVTPAPSHIRESVIRKIEIPQSVDETVKVPSKSTVNPEPFQTEKPVIEEVEIAQPDCDIISTVVMTLGPSVPLKTVVPEINGTVTAADTIVSGKAPSGANVVLSVNGKAQPVVEATGGKWAVMGLVLTEGDVISITAKYGVKTLGTASTIVASAPSQTIIPSIFGIVTEADKTISGKAPSGTNVVLNINGEAQPAVIANGGIWTVSGLNLAQGDSISVTAQFGDETVNTSSIMTVAPAPLQTGEPVISGIITAADSTVSGTAPSGANVVLSINGKSKAAVVATSGKIISTGVTTKVAPAPVQTAEPVISGIVKTADTTVSGTAPCGANVMLSVNEVPQSEVAAIGGNWIVSSLILKQGDVISVTAQSAGETVSNKATTVVI